MILKLDSNFFVYHLFVLIRDKLIEYNIIIYVYSNNMQELFKF